MWHRQDIYYISSLMATTISDYFLLLNVYGFKKWLNNNNSNDDDTIHCHSWADFDTLCSICDLAIGVFKISFPIEQWWLSDDPEINLNIVVVSFSLLNYRITCFTIESKISNFGAHWHWSFHLCNNHEYEYSHPLLKSNS